MKAFYLLCFLLLFNSTILKADENVPKKPVELGLQILESGDKYLALNFKNYPEWHTYWKNPGDAGLSIESKFYINDREINLMNMEWPIPHKFIEQGDQWAFGYVGEYSHFYKLDKNFQNKYFGKKITLKSKWLVCKNICVPGMKEVHFTISRSGITVDETDLLSTVENTNLTNRLTELPKVKSIPDYLSINLSKADAEKALVLKYEVKKTTDVGFLKTTNLFFPFPQKPFDFNHEKIHTTNDSIIGITPIAWDGEYQTPPETLNPNGKFKKPYLLRFLFNDPITRETYIVEKKFTGYELAVLKADNAKLIEPMVLEKKNDSKNLTAEEKPTSALIYYLILALFGGLILNVMPCVLPVISIKLFGLIKYQQESKARILKHNIFYSLGILFTFMVLATVIVILKSFGTNVGWGFQLQSPNFIAVMIVGLFIFSLNLFGMFEFHTPLGHHVGNVKIEDNFIGDFLGGVVAVILSTPCSAPFLGTALTFAFTSNAFTIYAIFSMIAIGLASPFIVTAIFPSLVSFLPKPGNWMNTLKKLLGVTLLLTGIWLLDVFNTLVGGQSHLTKLMAVLVLIFAGFIIKKKEKWLKRSLFILATILLVNMANTPLINVKEDNTALIRDKMATGLNWEAWSIDKMNEYKDAKQVVFIDFTAKWCFTCKVNERLVLDTEDFKNLVKEKNLKLLIGDWTKRDEVIGNFLMQNKLVGVPAYFIQKEDGTLINLGETITIAKIKSKL